MLRHITDLCNSLVSAKHRHIRLVVLRLLDPTRINRAYVKSVL
jgi:hypothetical protein